MKIRGRLGPWLNQRLEAQRLSLSRPDALVQLAGLGILTGLLAGGLIVAFRLVIELSQTALLPGGDPEGYEALPPGMRIALPLAGGLLIGLLFHLLGRRHPTVGVVHVMERLAYHQGHMGLRPMLLQFLGAAAAIVSGQSVGREGPAIHLGAATGSLLGQRLSLPNNSIRTMVGCGTAAAIGAGFNTPLAGVVFALEVVMMEYTLASFTPVILAAVCATAVSIGVFGPEPAFQVPRLELGSLRELPLVALLGLLAGIVAAAFIQLVQTLTRISRPLRLWQRTALAGLITGLCAQLFPEVMGIGYDTVTGALLGQLTLLALAGIAAFKLMATAACIGLGVPGGLIGPILVTGAALGGAVGLTIQRLAPGWEADAGLYALLGLGALMGATLQAPLAALTAMLELTANPAIILPGMLAVVIAGLTCSEVFGKHSVFVLLLRERGLDYRNDPVVQALRRIGVASVMDRRVIESPALLSREQAEALLGGEVDWLLLRAPGQAPALMPSVDLARELRESDAPQIDLYAIPAERRQATPVHLRSTLQEAREALSESGAEAVFVERMTAPGIRRVYGVLTDEQIERAYRP